MFPRGHNVKTAHGYVNRLYPTANFAAVCGIKIVRIISFRGIIRSFFKTDFNNLIFLIFVKSY